jgi:hypothetical protein
MPVAEMFEGGNADTRFSMLKKEKFWSNNKCLEKKQNYLNNFCGLNP